MNLLNDLINDLTLSIDGKQDSSNSMSRADSKQSDKPLDYHTKKYGNRIAVTTVPDYRCPHKKCDGTGWIITSYPPCAYKADYPYSTDVASKCICNGGKTAGEYRRIHSMIPFEYLDSRSKDFKWGHYTQDTSTQKSVASGFILKFDEFANQGKGLYIYSSIRGSGKTFLSCCIANELSERGAIVKFINVLDLIELCSRSFDRNAYKGEKDAYKDELDSLFSAKVLILDDIGCESTKDWFNEFLLRLINARHGNKKITIYTSNLPIDKLKVDDRISTRIQESSISIRLPEESIRTKLAKETNDEFLKSILGS